MATGVALISPRNLDAGSPGDPNPGTARSRSSEHRTKANVPFHESRIELMADGPHWRTAHATRVEAFYGLGRKDDAQEPPPAPWMIKSMSAQLEKLTKLRAQLAAGGRAQCPHG